MFKGNQFDDVGVRKGVPKFNIGIYRKNYIFDFSSESTGPISTKTLQKSLFGEWRFKFVKMVPLVPRVLDLGAQKGQNVLFL